MRKIQLLACAASTLVMLISAHVSAQEPAKADVPPPPKLEKLEEGEPPTITIRQPSSKTQIIEQRGPGNELKEIKVKSGPSTYILRPRQGTGNTPADDVVIPQWVIHEFNGKTPKGVEEKSEPQQLQPAPSAPQKRAK